MWPGSSSLRNTEMSEYTKVSGLYLCYLNTCFRDNDDNTPLHHAACQGWTQCMKTLMGIHSNLLDVKNNHGVSIFSLLCQRSLTEEPLFCASLFLYHMYENVVVYSLQPPRCLKIITAYVCNFFLICPKSLRPTVRRAFILGKSGDIFYLPF